MGRIFEILSILLVLRTCNSTPFHLKYCKTDSECNDERFYCYEARECVECTNCSAYNRQVSPTTRCAKSKDECGHCTSGTEAEHNFDGTFTCHPSTPSIINTNSNENSNINEDSNHLALIIPVAILVSVALVFLIIYFLKRNICDVFKRFLPNQTIDCPPVLLNNNPPPPPYSEKNPSASAPPEEDPLINRTRIIHDDNQRANPFHNPNYIRGGMYSDNPPPDIITNATEIEITPNGGDDENTQPSGWSPSDIQPNQPTTFSNILSPVHPSVQHHQEQDQPTNHDHSHHFSQSATGTVPPIIITINNNNLSNTQVIN